MLLPSHDGGVLSIRYKYMKGTRSVHERQSAVSLRCPSLTDRRCEPSYLYEFQPVNYAACSETMKSRLCLAGDNIDISNTWSKLQGSPSGLHTQEDRFKF